MNIHIVVLLFFLEIFLGFFLVLFLMKTSEACRAKKIEVDDFRKNLLKNLRETQFLLRHSKDKIAIFFQMRFASRIKRNLRAIFNYLLLFSPFFKKGRTMLVATVAYDLSKRLYRLGVKN